MEKKYIDRGGLAIVRVLGETLFLYGLLAWAYGVLIALIHPDLLPTQLSHLTTWIRTDTFTIISFLISILGFLIWRLTKELSKH